MVQVVNEAQGGCALKGADGSVWCWGVRNADKGALAVQVILPTLGPVKGVRSLVGGYDVAGWIIADGTYYQYGTALTPGVPCP
jgi:hypothetical protein